MKRFLFIIALTVAMVSLSERASANTVARSEYKCPLGGEVFPGDVRVEAYAEMQENSRDLIAGPLWTPPIVQCPNGFLIARPDYTPRDIAQIVNLMSQPAFRRPGLSNTYEQLWWLRKLQGADVYELTELLFLADREISIWRYSGYDSQSRTYLEAVAELPYDPAHRSEWFRAYLRAVNILREKGQFELAEKLLDRIAHPALRPANGSADAEMQSIRLLIAEKNAEQVPVTLVSPKLGAIRCLEPTKNLTASEKQRCSTPALVSAVRRHCSKFYPSWALDHAPPYCARLRRWDNGLTILASLLAVLFLAMTFREFLKSDRKGRRTLGGG